MKCQFNDVTGALYFDDNHSVLFYIDSIAPPNSQTVPDSTNSIVMLALVMVVLCCRFHPDANIIPSTRAKELLAEDTT